MRLLHGRQRIQKQFSVSKLPGRGHDAFGEEAPDFAPSRGGNHIQAFDFAGALGDLPQTDTAEIDAVLLREKESSEGGSIFAREMLQFVREILKAQVYLQRRRVLFDQFPAPGATLPPTAVAPSELSPCSPRDV